VQAWPEDTVYDSKPAYMNLSIVQISRRLPDEIYVNAWSFLFLHIDTNKMLDHEGYMINKSYASQSISDNFITSTWLQLPGAAHKSTTRFTPAKKKKIETVSNNWNKMLDRTFRYFQKLATISIFV
jgi:hypothetical protein